MSSRAEKKAFRFSTSCLQIVQNYHKETPFLSGTIKVQSGRQERDPPSPAFELPTMSCRQDSCAGPAAGAAPLKKHCPPANARQQPRRRTDYQQPPSSRKCLGVPIYRQRRFLLLSTALAVFVWLRIKPLSLASLASVRVKPLSLASLASSPSRGALGIPLCLHRYSVTVLVHAPLTVANLLHESPSFPSDTRPERGSGLLLRQKP